MVEYSLQDGVARITLNRPEKRNALNDDMVASMRGAFERAEQAPDCRVIVLQGRGKAFCAGADLAHLEKLANYTPEENLTDSIALKDMLLTIRNSTRYVIAQVEGPTMAGGCGILSVCDYVVATPESVFAYTETRIGFVPAIVAVFLLERLPARIATPLLLHARNFTPAEALGYGFIHEVVEGGQINERIEWLARQVADGTSGNSVAQTKMLINEIIFSDIDRQLDRACRLNVEVRQSEDFRTGIRAVLEKRPPQWGVAPATQG